MGCRDEIYMNLFYILSIHTVKDGCFMSLCYGGMFMFSWVMKLFQLCCSWAVNSFLSLCGEILIYQSLPADLAAADV